MAQINVTDILSDPDFTDPIQLIDRKPTVNYLGENILKECVANSIGSVQPASGRVLERLPEALRQKNVSSFFYRGVITASSTGKYASILVFRGLRYNVESVQDYSNWGEGWTEGVCVQADPS